MYKSKFVILGIVLGIVFSYITVVSNTSSNVTNNYQIVSEKTVKNSNSKKTEKVSANELAKTEVGRKDVVSGLNGMKVVKEEGELSKAIENNSHASGLNGLSLGK